MWRMITAGSALLLAALIGILPVRAAEQTGAPKQERIYIEADRMESFDRRNEVLFTGRVEAKQGDIVLHADEMTVFYQSNEPAAETKPAAAGDQQVEKLFAKGNVKVTSTAWVATGDTMDYFATERKAILIGNAKVWQENNTVTGDKIILFLDEGRSIVERRPEQQGERVKAFIYPDSDKQQQ